MPIKCPDGKVLGTFGTYYRDRRSPTPEEREGVEVLAAAAAQVLAARRAAHPSVRSFSQNASSTSRCRLSRSSRRRLMASISPDPAVGDVSIAVVSSRTLLWSSEAPRLYAQAAS